MTRFFKQFIILAVFLLVAGGGFYIYYAFQRESTCFDNVQNQNEEGVDCGGVCPTSCLEKRARPIEVKRTQLLIVQDFDYDVFIELSNPNSGFGASRVEYTLKFSGPEGIFAKSGVTYIAPSDTRTLIESPVSLGTELTSAEFTIDKVTWAEPKQFPIYDIEKLFSVRNRAFDREKRKFSAVLANTSDFSFDNLDVNVLLITDGKVVAVNKTNIRTLLSRTAGEGKSTRYFEVFWPNTLPDSAEIVVEVNTNILDEKNFLRLIRTPERFQQ